MDVGADVLSCSFCTSEPSSSHDYSSLLGLVASGTLNIDNVATPINYTYTVETDNNNGRTLQGFSTGANTRMRPGDDTSAPYFSDFQKFFNYYGTYDYADKIITAGLEGTNANLANGNILLQSSGIGMDGRVGTSIRDIV